jgi:flagellar biosynthetic protein FlhB
MADEQDKASKTEEPTQKRLNKAREEGNFAKAEEIQVVFGLAAAFVLILFYSSAVGSSMAQAMQGLLSNLSRYAMNPEFVVASAKAGIGAMLFLMMPIFAVAIVASVIAGGLQSGFRLAPKAIGFKGSKINPVKNAQQKWGKQALVKFAVDLSKLLAVAAVIAFAVFRITRHPIFHTRIEIIEIAAFILETTLYLLALLLLAMGMIAAVHFLYQKQKVHSDLMMTKQEVKDEHKQQEGDPQVKSARRQLARRLAQRQMFEAIPGADVVVTNPTHFAVALRYDRNQDAAPVVLAKGKNLIAQRIKEIARAAGVPLVENRPAAQTLFKLGQVGKPIPQEMYKVVAEVLAYVYRTNKQFFRRRGRLNR